MDPETEEIPQPPANFDPSADLDDDAAPAAAISSAPAAAPTARWDSGGSMRRVLRSLIHQDPAERDVVSANFDHVKRERLLHLQEAERAVLDYVLDFHARTGEPPLHRTVYEHFETLNDANACGLIEEFGGQQLRDGASFAEAFEEEVQRQGRWAMKSVFREAITIATEGLEIRKGERVQGVESAVSHVRDQLAAPPARGEPTDPVERDHLHLVARAASPAFMSAPAADPTYLGFLEVGQVALLSAVSNAGKTSFALWLAGHFGCGAHPAADAEAFALAVANEEDDPKKALAKVHVPSRPMVLFVSAEATESDLGRIADRFRTAGRAHLGCPTADFARENFYALTRDPEDPDRFDAYRLSGTSRPEPWTGSGAARLAELVEELKAEVNPGSPEEVVPLVVVDTLARLGPRDGNENNNAALTYLVEQLERLASSARAAVLVLHHVSQADHGLRLEKVDPRTFGRGGTGAAAAARCVIAMAQPGFGDGRVVGLKVLSNNVPPREPVYFEVCAEGAAGIRYFRPIPPAEVEELREAAAEEADRKKREGQPSAADLRARLWDDSGAGPHSMATAKRITAALWRKPNGEPYSETTKAVRALAEDLVQQLVQDGDARRAASGQGGTERFELLGAPPAPASSEEVDLLQDVDL